MLIRERLVLYKQAIREGSRGDVSSQPEFKVIDCNGPFKAIKRNSPFKVIRSKSLDQVISSHQYSYISR